MSEDIIVTQESALPPFVYSSGYEVSFIDLGDAGVKIEMNHSWEISGAIILPPEKTDELDRWLQDRIGRMHKRPDKKK